MKRLTINQLKQIKGGLSECVSHCRAELRNCVRMGWMRDCEGEYAACLAAC